MPYMDYLLRDLEQGDPDVEVAYSRHVHWGLWDSPEEADGSFEDYGRAAERMSRRMCDAAGIQDGMRVLDCGCGLGGTIASLNDRYSNLDLVGLNIDDRQLAVAQQRVTARPGNETRFVLGDACALPFEDNSFDAVLAVECIFHFGSRLRFLREARRVLRPGGRLAFSDFVPRPAAFPAYLRVKLTSSLSYYGYQNPIPATLSVYRLLFRRAKLRLLAREDVTERTLPTYRVLLRRYQAISEETLDTGLMMERISRRGLTPYTIFELDRPARS